MAELRGLFPDARFYDPAALHVTAAFLGDLPAGAVPSLLAAAAAAEAESPSPASAALAGLGGFPSWSRARVLWAGVGEGGGAMGALQASLSRRLAASGFALEDRRYSPHCTLGRVKGGASAAPPAPPFPPASFPCGPVRLYESRLEPAGARHAEVRA